MDFPRIMSPPASLATRTIFTFIMFIKLCFTPMFLIHISTRRPYQYPLPNPIKLNYSLHTLHTRYATPSRDNINGTISVPHDRSFGPTNRINIKSVDDK